VPAHRQAGSQSRQATLAVAIAGGYVAYRLHMPLAWLLGAMVAVAPLCFASREVATVALARPVAMLVLGTALGQTDTLPGQRALAGSRRR
jgi:uncharacterized membrane protein AbrB (regulator of aidB expression)